MTEAIKVVTFINIIFIILLVISGMFPGTVGEILYYLAFIAPIAIGFYFSMGLQYKREEQKGLAESAEVLLGFSLVRSKKLLPLVFPAVMTVFLSSLVTSLLLSLVGVSAPPVEEKGIVMMLAIHALIPAILEEALFRYIPMKLLLPYSKRWCVIYSALCFALIHCSLYQMPYAFVAGIIFMMVDVAFDSVWPSVILHFVNNAASVIWLKYCSGITGSVIFISTLALLSLISIFFIYRRRESYRALFRGSFDKGESFAVTYAPLALAAITFYLAFLNL
ncbi:MAG: CPBP family intramembrane metalloprotease [Clostridia bacterium]|nr:CPBP family intramembrane metalloprotease [Clostridia bacterium]